MKYPLLFSPLAITPTCVLKNRIVKTGQSTSRWNTDGTAEDSDALRLYENIARGGAAAIFIGGCAIEDTPGIYLGLWDDKFIPGIRELTGTIQAHDCKIFAQFHHSGPAAWPRLGALPISSSSLGVDELPMKPPLANPFQAMTIEQIHEKQDQIVAACVRADQGGFDGMKIHVAHGYLLNSFVRPIWNHRSDEYGIQSVESRTRIVREIFERVRREVRPEFVLGVRMNGREYCAKNGLTIEESVENARAFEAMGAQFINVAGYGYAQAPFRYCPDYFPYPEVEPEMAQYLGQYRGKGLWTDSARHIKQPVHVPVITAGRMTEETAEKILADGDADLIGIGRGLWADPELPRKLMEDRPEDIVRCTRCASCEDPVPQPRICRVNPSLGRDREMDMSPAARRKKIMVVGGGPAGMEAARVATLRGHDVTIYDKKGALGGRLPLASMIKGDDVEDVMPIIRYLKTQVKKLGIKTRLRTEVTPELVAREKPDVVVLANSSSYFVPKVPGIDGGNVFTIKGLSHTAEFPLQVLGPKILHNLSKMYLPLGKRVVVLGGQIEGTQGAVFLKKRGRDVTVVEESDSWGKGIPERYFQRIVPWFKKKGIEVLTETTVEKVDKKGVTVRQKDGSTRFLPCDSVLVLMPQKPSGEFADALKKLVPKVHVIGSALGTENGLIKHALYDGRKTGCEM